MNTRLLEGSVVLLTATPEVLLVAAERNFRDAGAQTCSSAGFKEGKKVPDVLVICALWNTISNEDEIGEELYAVVDHLKTAKKLWDRYPRYVVMILPRKSDHFSVAGAAAGKTLCGYLATHLIAEDVRINLILCPQSTLGMARAADTAFAICSGLLDDLRGQTLTLSET